VGLIVFFIEGGTVLEIAGVLEMGGVLVPVAVVDGQGEGARVAVTVLVAGGVPVGLACFV
jgi:hypothetical protein